MDLTEHKKLILRVLCKKHVKVNFYSNTFITIYARYTLILYKIKASIFNALPSPRIQTTTHDTYITLTSRVDYFLAYCHKPEYITANDDMNTKDGIVACELANKIRHQASKNCNIGTMPMILYLLFWSDDFEGFLLQKKQKFSMVKNRYNLSSTRPGYTSKTYICNCYWS